MIVFVNDTAVEIFRGARVRDVILAYSIDDYTALQKGKRLVRERMNYITEPDGPVVEGQHLSIESIE
jgi:hypothetical protein